MGNKHNKVTKKDTSLHDNDIDTSSTNQDDISKHQSYQYNATGPLKHILPEFEEDWYFYGRTQQNSYFNWKAMYCDGLKKLNHSEPFGIEDFVKFYWQQTCKYHTIEQRISPVNDVIFNEKGHIWTFDVIKNVNNPNSSTIMDIATIMTSNENINLYKYDEKIIYGFVRSINRNKLMIDDILQICLMFINDDRIKELQPISNDWKWGNKVLNTSKYEMIDKYGSFKKDIYNVLMDIVKNHRAWKCLFVRGKMEYRRGNISEDWDTMDIWWLVKDNTVFLDEMIRNNCIVIRFHRYWYENDK